MFVCNIFNIFSIFASKRKEDTKNDGVDLNQHIHWMNEKKQNKTEMEEKKEFKFTSWHEHTIHDANFY